MSFIELSSIYKVYNKKYLAINDFNLNIEHNEFVALIGPSGCGKSTLLRMIAGLEDITYGELKIENKIINDVHAKDRDMSMVFQNYALYPHMTNYENIGFGLTLRKVPRDIIKERVEEVGKLLDLEDYLDKHPSELSGGQRQRVALGRAMVQNSKIFLMDEPLSNLDAKLRNKMRMEILKLHKQLGVTTIYVTHDQVEAMTMADKIVVMNQGEIQQVGHPRDLYYNPRNIFVAKFIGDPDINILEGKVMGDKILVGDKTIQINPELYTNLDNYQNKNVHIGVRAEDIRTENVYLESSNEVFKSKIELIEMRGDSSVIFFNFEGEEVSLKVASNQNFELEQIIEYTINKARVLLFDIETGGRI